MNNYGWTEVPPIGQDCPDGSDENFCTFTCNNGFEIEIKQV
jgi:hypothetical protein